MIKRNSIIIFAVFLVLLAGVLYINQDSNLQTSLGMQTPTPTQQPKVISGIDFSTIHSFEISQSTGYKMVIAPNAKNEWITDTNQKVNLQAALQATQSLIDLSGTITQDQSLPLEKIGLNPPLAKIVLTDAKGNKGTLNIGNQSATQTGYYVKWENNPVILVPSAQIDSLMGSFSPNTIVALTPQPDVTQTP